MKALITLMAITIGSALGFCLIGLQLSHDEHVKKVVEQHVMATLSRGLGCSLNGRLESFNLLTGMLEFSDVIAEDRRKSWRWHAQQAFVSFSRFELLLHRVLKLHITLAAVEAFSHLNGIQLAITSHIKAWISLPAGPLVTSLKSLRLRDARIRIIEAGGQAPSESSATLHGQLTITAHAVQIAAALGDATVTRHGVRYFEAASGLCRAYIPRTDAHRSKDVLHLDLNAVGKCACLPSFKPQCSLTASWQSGKVSGIFYSEHHEMDAKLVGDTSAVTVTGKVPYRYVADFMGHAEPEAFVGDAAYVLTSSPKALALKKASGTVTLNAGRYRAYDVPQGTLQFKTMPDTLQGEAALSYGGLRVGGDWQWDMQARRGHATCANVSEFVLPGVGVCPSQAAHADIALDAAGIIEGSYGIDLDQNDETIKGNFKIGKHGGEVTIARGEGLLALSAKFEPRMHLSALDYKEGDGQQATVICSADGAFEGRIEYGILKKLTKLLKVGNMEVGGERAASVRGRLKGDKVFFESEFDQARIRLPETYTIVQAGQLRGELDWRAGSLILHEGQVTLNKGKIRIPHANLSCPRYRDFISGDVPAPPIFVHMPLILDDCFVHWKKDIIGSVSGILTLSITDEQALIKGYVTLDKTHIQSNVLSSKFEAELTKGIMMARDKPLANVKLDIGIISGTLVRVKTAFLKADALFRLALHGTLAMPELSGSIQLAEGVLNFPYQPLYITHGRIYFFAHQLQDPTLELAAKNKIKNYVVTMNVTGSLRQPLITFTSSPELTEGQIITLLLGGAEDGSLFLAMPVSLTNSIENLMFGPAESTSQLQRYLGNLFKPLKSVRIVPRFSDESGRGGLRGSLMIEVNDNLRATIQKNFDLSEDVLIEVEYGLPNNMVIRAVKDERGDLGAELEKVWKFSRP